LAELFFLFAVYGGWLIFVFNTLLWQWSGIALLLSVFLALLAPLTLIPIVFHLWRLRKRSVAHQKAFRAAIAYYPLVLLSMVAAFVFPPVIEATFALPDTSDRIVARISPSHPYLAEYERSIELIGRNGQSVRARLFPDTGGYRRTQIYRGSDGSYYAKGFFDVARLDPTATSITMTESVPVDSTYLGAFDADASKTWRFLTPEESYEEPLIPQGG